MKRMAQVALLLSLVEKLHENHSWCGETHIQKATYFLKEMLNVELDYNFILYKHGPYSFDLSDELGRLRADGQVKVISQFPYGPSILPSSSWESLKSKFPKTLTKYGKEINFIGSWLGDKRVSELEKLATALYVMKEGGSDAAIRALAKRIVELKPHINPSEAEEALREVEDRKEEAQQMMLAA